MSIKTINPATAWEETYRNTPVAYHDGACVNVFTAIHGSCGPFLRVEIATWTDTIDVKAQANLTPEQAEAMAAELLLAAKLKREYDAAWADHIAAQLPEAA